MTEDSPSAVTARDRTGDPRFSTFSPSGFPSEDDRTESWDRSSPLEEPGRDASDSVESGIDLDTEVELLTSRPPSDRQVSLESTAVTNSALPPPIPDLPLAIDPMPLTASLPLTVNTSPSHGPTSSPPPSPRMRRTSRRSPNARSERPAPSSIPTSDFSDLSSRLRQRRGSLPTSASTRSRAHSVSPAAQPPESAESSRSSRRHLDPDQHWLSEDEATGSVGGTAGHRQRTSGRRRGVQRGFDSDSDESSGRRKPRIDEIFASRFGRSSHEIHHRPSNFEALPTSSAQETVTEPTSFTSIVPRLLETLSCPHCDDLLHTPITFGCGHSRCHQCPSIKVQHSSTTETPTVAAFPVSSFSPVPQPDISPALPGKDRSNPVASFIPGSFPDLTNASKSTTIKPTSEVSGLIPSLPSCGVDNCRHAEFSPLPPRYSSGPKTDYNLRKIIDHLRKAMSETALVTLVDPTDGTSNATFDGSLSIESKDKTIVRMPSDSSGSSGGGEDVTKGVDDAKRAHKHSSTFKPVKSIKKSKHSPDDELSSPSCNQETEEDAVETESASRAQKPVEADVALSDIAATFFSEVQAECECQVCVQLLIDPITSPCGHSFCRNCLARAYDHSSKCPLCRSDLPPLPYFHRERTNIALKSVIETAFPRLAAERAASIKEDELAHLANVPIFICTTAWPGVPTFLHIFEPRYRLMMRRALESPSREFGMVLPARDGSGGVNEYGTMLRITDCNVMEDGRSIVHSIGTWRFKIVERWMIDGYNVGRVERVEDVSLEQELELEQAALRSNDDEFAEYRDPQPSGPISLTQRPDRPPMTGNMELPIDQLMHICFDFIRTLKAQSAPWVLQRLNNTVGEMPTTPAEFTWWCGEVMPVEDHVKVALLSITSVRERLRLIVFWIEQFRSSWWYSRGCNIM